MKAEIMGGLRKINTNCRTWPWTRLYTKCGKKYCKMIPLGQLK